MSKLAAREPVMRSTAHHIHASMGAAFERRGAWEVPATYGSDETEAAERLTELGFADVSARGKLHLSGNIEPMIRRLTGGSVEPGRTANLSSGGRVARIARDWALVLLPASGESRVMAEVETETSDHSMVTDVTSGMSAFMVAGQRFEEVLARTVTIDIAELRPGSCAAASWARIPAVLVRHAVPVVEIYVASDHGRYAWDTIRGLCGRLGGSPVGWRSLKAWGWQ